MNDELIKKPVPLGFDPPRWWYETYPEMDMDMAKDIFAAIFYKRQLKKGNKELPEDTTAQALAISNALMESATQLRGVNEASNRAFLRTIWATAQNGRYHTSAEEYDTIEEWLSDRISDLSATSGELSNVVFLLQHVFPMLEKVGGDFDPIVLLGMKNHWSKTRAAVPFMRTLVNDVNNCTKPIEEKIEQQKEIMAQKVLMLEELELNSPESIKLSKHVDKLAEDISKLEKECRVTLEEAGVKFQQGIAKTLEVIADPTIEVWEGPNNVANALFSDGKKFTHFEGERAPMGKKVISYVEIDTAYERAFVSATQNIVEWKDTDPKVIRNIINEKFNKE